jgi:hypothetical protein
MNHAELGYLHILPRTKVKNKAIPVTGCETSRLPHLLDNRLSDSSEVSLTRRPPFTPQEGSWYSVISETESNPKGIVHLEGVHTR